MVLETVGPQEYVVEPAAFADRLAESFGDDCAAEVLPYLKLASSARWRLPESTMSPAVAVRRRRRRPRDLDRCSRRWARPVVRCTGAVDRSGRGRS